MAAADDFDPPANYYATATGTGGTLKQQLNDIIDGHTVISYDAARSVLQVTDEDPADPNRMILVYNRISLNVAAINPGGSIPGWDSAATWNREHTWPESRLGSGGQAVSDLFNLRPSTTSVNSDRGNDHFGGAYGQSFGTKNDGGATVWYPGDADAGMIARQEFYMAMRYDGSDSNTSDIELLAGVPSQAARLGNLNRLIEWHFAAPPDHFERRRNEIIYDGYQHNRNPFTDRPEYAWSIFVNQANDSMITIQGGVPGANGASTRNVDLGRVVVGAPVPANQTVALSKSGNNGTYYQVTTAGLATSTVTGRFNAFRTGMADSRSIGVGLAATTATAGLKSGTITVDNLDVTSGGGASRGANDGNDVLNVAMNVLDHANPSFSGAADANSLTYDFGSVFAGSPAPTFSFDVFNLPAMAGFTAGLDLDSIISAGDAGVLATNLSPFSGATTLEAGDSHGFTAILNTTTAGEYAASYTLSFSDENLPGAASLGSLTLHLSGQVIASATIDSGDFDDDNDVDGADFLHWQRGVGTPNAASDDGDANGDQVVDAADLAVWSGQFGENPSPLSAVPEPAVVAMAMIGVAALILKRRGDKNFTVACPNPHHRP